MPEALFSHKDNKKNAPSDTNDHYDASGPGVLGVQNNGAGRGNGKGGSPGELGLDESGSGEDDDPDI